MIFLFSTFTGLPDTYLNGYAFSGPDFISGPESAMTFKRETGRHITSGQDGCYLSIWKDGETHRIGVDYSGYKKVYYYLSGGIWAISNSVIRLTEHLRDNGIQPSPDPVQLRSLEIESTLTTQLSSFETVVCGIKLLPSNFEIVVSKNGAVLSLRGIRRSTDYRSTLKYFIETWLARLETLITDGRTTVSCDLTGGKDSRVVFGMIMKAQARLGILDEANCYIRSGSGDRWKNDLIAAKRIADHYGVKLNRPMPPISTNTLYGNQAAYMNWKDLNLCTYFPVYFAPRSGSSFSIHLHGGGGENHRQFYPYKSFDDFSKNYLTDETPDPMLKYWVANVGEVLRQLKTHAPGMDEWILHYREFRSRIHGGRAPQYRNVISPLAGRDMEQLSNFPGKSSNSQVHFDVMASLFPELMHFPYDDPSKGPSDVAVEKLTAVTLENQASPGKAYIDPDIETGVAQVGGPSPLQMLLHDFEAASTPAVREAMPDLLKKARRARDAVRGKKAFGHASDAKNITRVMTAAFVLP